MEVEASSTFFETPEQIFARVFRLLRPRTVLPVIAVRFCRFANANSFIRLEGSQLEVKITDILHGAPGPILEALAFILLSKLFRLPVPPTYHTRYRRYLNRGDVRGDLHRVRRMRGRKLCHPPQGECFNLVEVFEELNLQYFHGLMARPELGWSLRPSRQTLGHYDPAHNTIVLSRLLDKPGTPRLAVEYVMYHEMLHLRHPVEHRGARRCVHTSEFREAEKRFSGLKDAKQALRKLG
jgi:Protein of unknown function DUF45